jgi:hypothetical protein
VSLTGLISRLKRWERKDSRVWSTRTRNAEEATRLKPAPDLSVSNEGTEAGRGREEGQSTVNDEAEWGWAELEARQCGAPDEAVPSLTIAPRIGTRAPPKRREGAFSRFGPPAVTSRSPIWPSTPGPQAGGPERACVTAQSSVWNLSFLWSVPSHCSFRYRFANMRSQYGERICDIEVNICSSSDAWCQPFSAFDASPGATPRVIIPSLGCSSSERSEVRC